MRLIAIGIAAWISFTAALALALAPAADTPSSEIKTAAPAPAAQTEGDAADKSAGCITCHRETDRASMHESPGVVLGCVDCHGGNATVKSPPQDIPRFYETPEYDAARARAHVAPRFPKEWKTPASANPEGSYTLLNRERPEFIRFVNPSDYRVAREACGACHLEIIQAA